MRKLVLFLVLFGLMVSISALMAGSVVAHDDLPTLADMTAGEWNMIEPGEDTMCAYGTPFKFFVRPASEPSDKVMVHFEGGGACWDADTCAPSFVFPPDDPDARPLFAQDISDNEMEGYTGGLFDFENPENPAADFNTVFIPYCTGDIHMGSTTQEYESSSGESYTIHHNGFANASIALHWMYENFEDPSDVFITGISAGALGQVLHTPYIMDHYKDTDANIVQLADSYVGVVARGWDGFDTWGAYDNRAADIVPAYEDMTPEQFTIANLYKGMASAFPQHTFSEFSSYVDTTQIFFYFLTGGGATPEEAGSNYVVNKQSIMNGLTANLPNFRAFQSWGNIHGITNVNDFYAYQVKGTRLRDWVADLLVDEPVRNVTCSLCTTPELYTP